jgi:3D (Asp-Asp-Asp) domain-containing protein
MKRPISCILVILFFIGNANGQSLEWHNVSVYTYKIKGKTATGKMTTDIHEPFLAISRDLLSIYPLFSYVEIYDCPWSGTYKVMDIMGRKHNRSIDIFFEGKPTSKNGQKCKCSHVNAIK